MWLCSCAVIPATVIYQSVISVEEKPLPFFDLHDFIVLPAVKPEGFDKDMRGVVMSEYSRLKFFSNLSMNGLEAGGATKKMREILELMEET